MKRPAKAVHHSLAAWPAALVFAAHAAVAADPPRVADLAWLAGCWEGKQPTSTVEEQWMAPAAGLMLGMNRTLRRGGEPAWEWLRLFERDATVVYVAAPVGQAPTEFVLEALTDDQAVFTNPAHDFPQTIRYRRSAEGRIVASAEGRVGGDLRILNFPMNRVDCAAAGPAPKHSAP
jgi:hypothetical protein